MPYTRAPIAEAVIDLNVTFREEPSIEVLERLAKDLKDRFPQAHRINSLAMSVGVNADSGIVNDTKTTQIGVRLTNQTGDRVLQLRRQGFSYSHLQPYSEWETFVGEMTPLWQHYVGALGAEAVTRSAVRYINRIRIPQNVELDQYLNLSPRLPDKVFEHIAGYFMQLVMPQRDLGDDWTAIINTGIEGSGDPETMTVLLDIDVFCTRKLPIQDAAVFGMLSELRHRKNKIFEAAITDEVRRMIK